MSDLKAEQAERVIEKVQPVYQFRNELESWLDFNDRVINEAKRPNNPILERLNFIGIADSNLDEFIRTKYQDGQGLKKAISKQTSLIEDVYMSLILELHKKYKIDIISFKNLKVNKKSFAYVKNIFMHQLYPLIQPLIIKNELPIPNISDGGTFILTKLESHDSKDITCIIRLPEIQLIRVKYMNNQTYITSDEIIKGFLPYFYTGKKIIYSKIFRVFRKIDSLKVDGSSNYMDGIRSQLYNRGKAKIIMTDIQSDVDGLESIIGDSKKRKRKFVGGLSFLCNAKNVIDGDKSMVYPKTKPKIPKAFSETDKSIFDVLSKEDVLVHFPYESFEASTVRFLEEASKDPDVLCIKQTLYRVSKNSRLTEALINAAKSGKQVVVLLELKAKMDEFNNLQLAEKLKEYGCHIIFGPVEMKTHAKTTLIIRRENDKLAKYVNISTGNFNEKTAKIYEDLSYFCKQKKKFRIGDDLCELYNHLGGYSELRMVNELLIAPVNFRSQIEKEIDDCIKNSGSSIVIKVNALTDKHICQKLYDASMAGVKIKLIVRGMCILTPGIKGLSENIEVISIVGRYLEHSRIYEFNKNIDGKIQQDIYIGSGDLMPRNLDHRIETLIQIKDIGFKKSLSNLLSDYFKDTVNSYKLIDKQYIVPDNEYTDQSFSIQSDLIKTYKEIEKTILM